MNGSEASPFVWSQLYVWLISGGIRLAAGIAILCIGWTAATWAKRGADRALARLPIDLTLKPLIASLVRYGILLLTVVLTISQFGVQTASLIAVLGAAGLAVGLALQGTLSNVASGVMLLVLRPFRVGQDVEVAGQAGKVREIGLFTTLLITADGVFVSIPNSEIFSSISKNFSREPIRRVQFRVPVDMYNDLRMVQKAALDAISATEFILEQPAPSVIVEEIQEYSVIFTVRGYVFTAHYWDALAAAQLNVKEALQKSQVLFAANRQAPVVRAEPAVDANRSADAAAENPMEDDATPSARTGT